MSVSIPTGESVNLSGPVCVIIGGRLNQTIKFVNNLTATVLIDPFECVPTDEDKMVIIVARDNEEHANSIAKTFHDAGVLTLGLLDNADLDCYDSVAQLFLL